MIIHDNSENCMQSHYSLPVNRNMCPAMVHIQITPEDSLSKNMTHPANMCEWLYSSSPALTLESDACNTSHSSILSLLYAISAEHLLHTLPPSPCL